jgi:MSHA biogenesis protein MshL
MKKVTIAVAAVLQACTVFSPPPTATYDRIRDELAASASASAAAVPQAVSAALMPPIAVELPKPAPPPEERLNVSFRNLPAYQFFTSIATGSSYNMLVHPRVAGNVTVELKNVTLFEALDAVRDLYGYDYTVEGNRILIRPVELRTQIFQVNYLNSNRRGFSDIRVTSGSSGDVSTGTTSTSSYSGASANTTTTGAGTVPRTVETAKIYTSSEADFWRDLRIALEALIGVERLSTSVGTAAGARAPTPGEGVAPSYAVSVQGAITPPCRGENVRCVVVSPQSGVVVVRAMPDELRSVVAFLKATQLSVDRQVMLEAKIIEVQLNDSFQSGVNWASFAHFANNAANQVAGGFLGPGTTLLPLGPGGAPQAISGVGAGTTPLGATPGVSLTTGENNTLGVSLGSMFGFAFQATNFAALISFLESQGTVHVLSSPRIATLNNQKAILKIGTDELFVTNVSTSTTVATGNTSTIQPPTVTLQSYFSGIVLDVTPQIDDRGNVNLHIRPSVTQVTSVNKAIDVGGLRPFNLPVPSSNTSETDSIVRGRDGRIIAIGGLMRHASFADRSQLPGAGDVPGVGALFRNRSETNQKRELVILLKPTIIEEGASWGEGLTEAGHRVQTLDPRTQWRVPEWQSEPKR